MISFTFHIMAYFCPCSLFVISVSQQFWFFSYLFSYLYHPFVPKEDSEWLTISLFHFILELICLCLKVSRRVGICAEIGIPNFIICVSNVGLKVEEFLIFKKITSDNIL